jgi:hypothetical protein
MLMPTASTSTRCRRARVAAEGGVNGRSWVFGTQGGGTVNVVIVR